MISKLKQLITYNSSFVGVSLRTTSRNEKVMKQIYNTTLISNGKRYPAIVYHKKIISFVDIWLRFLLFFKHHYFLVVESYTQYDDYDPKIKIVLEISKSEYHKHPKENTTKIAEYLDIHI